MACDDLESFRRGARVLLDFGSCPDDAASWFRSRRFLDLGLAAPRGWDEGGFVCMARCGGRWLPLAGAAAPEGACDAAERAAGFRDGAGLSLEPTGAGVIVSTVTVWLETTIDQNVRLFEIFMTF